MARIWERVRGKVRRFALTLPIMLAILGPGIITGNVDNDAGGITTYSVIGARFGYSMLWMLLLITFTLAMIQEMSARMGVVTGKGLADLIRERFGIRLTMVVMLLLVFTNLTNTMGEFAGVAGASSILGLNRFLVIPVVAFFVWLLVVKGSYRAVEKVLLVFCILFLTYVISAFMAHPNWGVVARSTVVPTFQMNPEFISLFIATIGTTIAPWMQFYQQSSVAEKAIDLKHYRYEVLDTYIGSFLTNFVSFFIVVACASTLFVAGVRVNTAAEAAGALAPLAGKYASILFAVGLINASIMAAGVLPLSTAYSVAEAFGWESGVGKSFREAPLFYGLYTALIVLGAGTIMFVPESKLIGIMLFSQAANGVLLPLILVLMLKLINDKSLMGEYVNSRGKNIAVWAQAIVMIILAATLTVQTVLQMVRN
ncbi:divalent metal cation transporter [Candidatus Cryosericum hinesii]|jgi:NRAMP (natural resistance-associated macrophage protein)-like metal ion transporter|uniref:Divalent metal cation transporter n=1 Tax=Candidatus Cryosericum hinesii TaxID=2290915 RepID=A0A398DDY0_9BACT|nr:Nramp family divalent metal transporter [Candidatus Cryosericum hinesii]RIE08815.1 divalent metal cation transporter [Candidatus Cryosericum hinesii]RIE12488.1 divalent metal cation transporter [Candidatus Cryosericum hinesii]RIE12683.1 divalent metal cation transporter [Candidatus Cryosericum hinesii]